MGYDKEAMYGVAKERKSIDFLSKRKICFGIAISCAFMYNIIEAQRRGKGKCNR